MESLSALVAQSLQDPTGPAGAALKLTRTVTNNLVVHPGEDKYTSIRLTGKAGAKLQAAPESVAFLRSFGFEVSADGETLAIAPAAAVQGAAAAPAVVAALAAVEEALAAATPAPQPSAAAAPAAAAEAPSSGLSLRQQARLREEQRQEQVARSQRDALHARAAAASASASDPYAGLSLKQKAARKRELEAAKATERKRVEREEQLAKLAQDKHVRQHDENWTSGVSAAAGKGGEVINTFRQKFGEDKGG